MKNNTPREEEWEKQLIEFYRDGKQSSDAMVGFVKGLLAQQRTATEQRVRTEMQMELDAAVMETEQRVAAAMREEKMKAIEELKFHLLNEETLQKKYPKLNKKHAKYKEEVALTNGYNWAITRLRVVLTEFKALSDMKSRREEKE